MQERLTVSGRNAAVSYFDASGNPCGRNGAVQVRIEYDDPAGAVEETSFQALLGRIDMTFDPLPSDWQPEFPHGNQNARPW